MTRLALDALNQAVEDAIFALIKVVAIDARGGPGLHPTFPGDGTP